MPRTGTKLPNPDDPNEIVQSIKGLLDQADGGISFGHPQDPASDSSTTLAGAGTHNGTLENLNGSWVEITFNTSVTFGSSITCTHNLNLDIPVSTEPNVRWLIFGATHDGTGDSGTYAIDAYFQDGDAITANSIDLFFGINDLTVNDASPLTVTLFFIPAVRFSGA